MNGHCKVSDPRGRGGSSWRPTRGAGCPPPSTPSTRSPCPCPPRPSAPMALKRGGTGASSAGRARPSDAAAETGGGQPEGPHSAATRQEAAPGFGRGPPPKGPVDGRDACGKACGGHPGRDGPARELSLKTGRKPGAQRLRGLRHLWGLRRAGGGGLASQGRGARDGAPRGQRSWRPSGRLGQVLRPSGRHTQADGYFARWHWLRTLMS